MRPGLAGILVLTALLSGCSSPDSSEIGAGDIAPAWEATAFDGTPVRLPDESRGTDEYGTKSYSLTEVVLPKRNGPDLDDVPERVRAEMTFHLAETYDDVAAAAFT